MNKWIDLTDVYGAPLRLKRELIHSVCGDCKIQGDGEKQFTVHGSSILMEGNLNYFVTETPEEINSKLDVPE